MKQRKQEKQGKPKNNRAIKKVCKIDNNTVKKNFTNFINLMNFTNI